MRRAEESQANMKVGYRIGHSGVFQPGGQTVGNWIQNHEGTGSN